MWLTEALQVFWLVNGHVLQEFVLALLWFCLLVGQDTLKIAFPPFVENRRKKWLDTFTLQ